MRTFFYTSFSKTSKQPDYYYEKINELKRTQRAKFDYEIDNELNESYYWTNISNLTIGCGLSDVLIESWSICKPATCYPGYGKGLNSLDNFGELICLYNYKELKNLITKFINNEWPSMETVSNLENAGLYGKGNGTIIGNIKQIIRKY